MPLSHIEYIQLAKQACDFVYRFCTYGASNRCNSIEHSVEEAAARLRPVQQAFFKQAEAICELPIPQTEQHEKIINKLSETIFRCNAGNCQEMAALAFRFLKYRRVAPLEVVSVPGHTFVMVGRDQSTDINNPSSWNKEAFVCDPWQAEVRSGILFKGGTVFPAEQLASKLDCSQLVSSCCYDGGDDFDIDFNKAAFQ